ncbi:inositol monophosphatase family protein [Musicola paradisiaca]|uniref:Inositol monophosphatase n=1 Tax=Musicola paradisiaca (strain Ech703) TaxID=579405 RepID=C6CBI6_MUSP7|nr:inositol monophosphatase family protein [Musicola paradisiaca]ACS84771.1 inositol monophosphatase [Musicola paradisiaca Ech703]
MKFIFKKELPNYLEFLFSGLREDIRKAWLAKISLWHLDYQEQYKGGQTSVDIFIDTLIKEYFDNKGCDCFVLSEENPNCEVDYKKLIFIIDPIDGTHNLIMGYHSFTTSIAVYYNNKYIMGWVYDISRDLIYKAAIGEGAYIQNIYESRKIKTQDRKKLSDMRVSFHRAKDDRLITLQRAIVESAGKIRVSSCSSLDICLVASGVLHAFIDLSIHGHERGIDVAAAKIILIEAGGEMMYSTGTTYELQFPSETLIKKHVSIIASSGKNTKQEILRLYNEVDI